MAAALSLTPILPVDIEHDADELVVCLDPGHSPLAGGRHMDVWTADSMATLAEWEINRDVSLEVARRLRARYAGEAVEVVLTWGEVDSRSRPWRALDGPASDERPAVLMRGWFCEQQGARLVVSLHTNGLNDGSSLNGTLTGFHDDDDRALADALHWPLLDAMRRSPDGWSIASFVDFGLDPGRWWISLGAPRSAVAVVEPVFMTAPAEAERLLPTIAEGGARRMQIAAAEAEAIAAYVDAQLRAR
jgi:N-acetylmuramoyl-L-alanine amidase